ncbi:MAG: helix-turn-helix domain-containing protein [Nitrobacter sp.]|uniref:helix-turn-helix domain-containing protein n=1 Tax=Nitrobacter sp. TaxID=29420 RepID=UPI0026136126|nr:helix-turn-helix domain-containing protein [Nitrobacter sp.]MCV0387132.1 helix-turn-helix domain-containing protein [Nitrobacter sp.]
MSIAEFQSNTPLVVSRAQACAMLGGISVSHLRRLMKAGELRPFDMNASSQPRKRGKLYFLVDDIAAFVERYAKRDQPTSPEW